MNLLHPTRVSANVSSGTSKFMEAFVLEVIMDYLKPTRSFEDWTGKVFGFLTVQSHLGTHPKNKARYWRCQCKCGNFVDASGALLKRGTVKSCGCARRENSRSVDMSLYLGKVFGELTVESIADKVYHYNVRCSCGETRVVNKRGLLSGTTKSCGHLKYECDPDKVSGTRLYSIWSAMRARCLRKTARGYKWYGAKGVTICSAWDDFKQFALDMGEPPEEDSTLDRRDTLGNYCPENCRWLSLADQQRNKSSNVVYDFEGQKLSLKQLSEITGIKESTLFGRIYTGMTVEEAVSGNRTTPYIRARQAGSLLYPKDNL